MFNWFGLAVMIIISLLIVNKLKCSNLMMIPIVIAEIFVYGIVVLFLKMLMPIIVIVLVLGIVYAGQHLWSAD